MSCYVVSETTICRAIIGMNSDYFNLRPVPLQSVSGLTKLGRNLIRMNVWAFLSRYEGRHQEDLPELDTFDFNHFNGSLGPAYTTPTQILKSMQCLRYQCSEGKVPNSDLFKGLQESIDKLANTIVTRTSEYEAADWG